MTIGVSEEQLAKLAEPFPAERVRWMIRTKPTEKEGQEPQAPAFAYIDARDVMRRLDEVLGPLNWRDSYRQEGLALICDLSVRVQLYPEVETGVGINPVQGRPAEVEWLTKSDGSGPSDIEGEKGAISGALKRAAVKWGVARNLYEMTAPWVTVQRRGKHWTIRPNEYPRLRKLLRGGSQSEAMAPPDEESDPQAPPAAPLGFDERVKLAHHWCEERGITRTMIAQLLEKQVGDPINEEDLATIRAQARLVNEGELRPEEAFGPSASQRADELDKRLGGSDG